MSKGFLEFYNEIINEAIDNIKYVKVGSNVATGYGLGGTHNSYVAMRGDNEFLVLKGETQPYSPIGGQKVLKDIVSGKTKADFSWKKMKLKK